MVILQEQEKDAKERAQRKQNKEKQVAAEAALSNSRANSNELSRNSGMASGNAGQGNGHGSASSATVVVAALQWVQCSRCSKWRKLGIGVDANSLPEVWTCTMNDWDNVHNNCAVPQEADDTSASAANAGGAGDYVGDGQLWTGAGAYRKIGQNKYSYRMLISTAMRQTSNAARRSSQTKQYDFF